MKILHVMAGAKTGGAETAFVELVTAQHQSGTEVYAVCRPAERNSILRNAHVPMTELPFGGLFDFKTKPALAKIINEQRPDVVVTWMNRAAKKLPKSNSKRPFKWIARLGGYYDIKYYPGVDHFIVNAPDLSRWLQDQGAPENMITFIPNFAEIEVDATPTPRAALDTPDDAFLFLSLARLHTNKAFDTLLDAFASVPNAYLWIGGNGPEETALKKQMHDLGLQDRVRFLGWRDDRWSLFAACDAVVFPSRHEPFGNTFMQAWASGKPLVTTASQGPSYFVRDGEDALVVPIDDANQLATAMNKVINDQDLRQKIAKGGLTRYAEVFDKKALLQKWADLSSEVAQKPSKS